MNKKGIQMALEFDDIEDQIVSFSKKIDFGMSEYTIEILASKIDNGEYVIPKYQREYTWDEARKSKFIESVLIGLPIPFLFFWQDDDSGKLEVVDGSQRLRTLSSFIKNELTIEKLERLDNLNGSNFSDLKLSRKRKFLNRSIRGVILSDKTDIESRIDLFERINTGSKVANPAEVRRGVLQGAFMDFVTKLSQNSTFKKLAPTSTKQEKERESEELVSRFFAYSDGLDDYRDDVSPFLFRYIKRKNTEFQEDPSIKKEYEKRFLDMLSFIDDRSQQGFKKSLKAKTTPRSRFEAISIGTSLALKDNPTLDVSASEFDKLLQDKKLSDEVRSDGANAKRRLNSRINFVKDYLSGL